MPSLEEEQTINLKQAYANAVQFAREALGERNFSLEEIDRGEYRGKPVWELTLGYIAPAEIAARGPVTEIQQQYSSLFPRSLKLYKRFFVNLHTGEVMSMKLRDE